MQLSLFDDFIAPVGSPGMLLTNFNSAGTDLPFGPLTGRSFLSPDSDFVYVFAREVNFTDDFAFLFAGLPTPAAMVSAASGALYSLGIDHTLGRNGGLVSPGTISFIRPADGGNLKAEDSARATILWDAANRPFFAANGILSGSGSSQRNSISVMVGNLLNDAANRPHLRGQFGGVARNSSTGRATFLGGGVATQDAGDGSDLFGIAGPHFFALEAAEMDSGDISFLDRGVDVEVLGTQVATYFPNVIGQRINSFMPTTRTTQTLKGFVGGIVETLSAPSGSFLGAQVPHPGYARARQQQRQPKQEREQQHGQRTVPPALADLRRRQRPDLAVRQHGGRRQQRLHRRPQFRGHHPGWRGGIDQRHRQRR